MNKVTKKTAALLLIAVLVTASMAVNVLATTREKRIDIGDGKCYITVSNVVDEKMIGLYPLYVANAPAKVTFGGGNLGRQLIQFSKDGKLKNNDLSGEYEDVKFNVEKYVININGTEKIVDSIPDDYMDEYSEAAGNYATLTKPGYYVVNGAPMAEAGKTFLIQVVGAAPVKAALSKLDLVTELVRDCGVEKEVIDNKVKYSKICTYKDVLNDSKNYIGYAVSKGWLTPKSKTEFGVKDKATEDMAARAALKAAGKAVNSSNIKLVIGKSTGPDVTKERVKQLFDNAKKLK